MEGLARAGKGTAEFVKEGERLQPKVNIIICCHFIYQCIHERIRPLHYIQFLYIR